MFRPRQAPVMSQPSARATVKDVLVATAAHVHADQMIPRQVHGADLATWGSACDGSSAGMIPSVSQDSWNASSASVSVIETYSARPMSCSQACSGPMPG